MTTKPDTKAPVAKAIAAAERSNSWVALKAGIPDSTLRRKLVGDSDFTISEIFRIASALRVPPVSLLPPEFRDEVKAAA